MYTSNVIRIIAEQLGISADSITEDSLFADIGADSLDLFQIISALEEEYDLEFDTEDAENIKSVKDAVVYIKNVLEQEG